MKNKILQLHLSDANRKYVQTLQCPNTVKETVSLEDKVGYLVSQARLNDNRQQTSPPHIAAMHALLDSSVRLPQGSNQMEAAAMDSILAWLPDTVSYILSQKRKHSDVSCFKEIDDELGVRVRQLLSDIVVAEHVLASNLYKYMKLDAVNIWPSNYMN